MLPVANKLRTARDLLRQPANELRDEEGRLAIDLLDEVHARVTSVPARLIGWVPVVSANLDAMEAVSGRVPPVIRRALDLRASAEELADSGVLRGGRVDLDVITKIRPSLAASSEALSDLRVELEENRGGGLAPPVWTAVDDLVYEVSEIEKDVRAMGELLDVTGNMLGAEGERTYLVLLMNNAELRGAGGILTGIGEMTASDGKLSISGFKSIHKLRTEKKQEVPVPEDFERFSIYGANDTSLFLNATYSPDVADVGLVSSRLYEEITGTKTDGALAIDPRGIAALMPEDAEVRVPRTDVTVSTDELPDFIYSDAYAQFDDQAARRDAILGAGERAFDVILDSGLSDQADLERAADAFAGGHIRVVSFEEDERTALDAVDASGDLEEIDGDSLLVTVQNRGGAPGIGSKMDFWEHRSISHGCEMASVERMYCVTSVSIRNEAPTGLPAYVTGSDKPYGRINDFVEIYVPEEAEITGLSRNGEEVGVAIEEQADRVSVGLSVGIDRGETSEVQVGYTLPFDHNGYSFQATPQPLVRDASIELTLGLPLDWTVRGPGRWEDDTFRYRGTLDRTLSVKAAPSGRSGFAALWESLTKFWNEPLF
jgi:hypothetical protein